MKHRIFLYSGLLLAVLSIGGCGGGGGGGGGGGHTSLATGTFTKTVDGVSAGLNGLPFNILASHILQQLYLASEINGAGFINRLSFRFSIDLASAVDCPNTTVKLGHTSLISLTPTFATNVEQGKGSQVTVINDATVTIPPGTGGNYFDVPLENPFYYNGVDNLVVEFVRNAACTGEVLIDTMDLFATTRQVNVQPIGSKVFLSTNLRLTKFNFAGGDNELNFGGTVGSKFPFSDETPRTQHLYLASEINGSGPVTGLAFQMNQVSTAETYTATIRMGHTTLGTLGVTYANNYDAGAPVIVADALTFRIPAGIPVSEWFWVPLPSSTFTYNGIDNLIVDVIVTAGSGNTTLRTSTIAGRLVSGRDNAAADAIEVDANAYHIKLRFNGGTMDVITAGNTSDDFLFSGTNNKRQYLYHAAELGTTGTITKVAARLKNDSVGSDYPNLSVVLGHTTNTTLGTTFSANMTEAQTVFTGTFSVPAGLKAGDWIEIPLNTSFAYDPTQNLVVQMSAQGGTATNSIVAAGPDAVLFLNRLAFANSNTTDAASTIDFLADLRLVLQ